MSTDSGSLVLKTKANLYWQFVYQIIILCLGILLPHFVINAFGSEVNGLTSTIKYVLQLALLAKAGISTAALYLLYKPLEEKDINKVCSIVRAVDRYFKRIGLLVFLIGGIASGILPLIQSGTIRPKYVFLACFLMSVHTALDLAFSSTYLVFFTAIQKRKYVSMGMLISEGLMYSLEILISILKAPFVLLFSCCLLGLAFKLLFFKFVFNREFEPFRIVLDSEKKNQRFTFSTSGMKYATLNEVSFSLIGASTSLIVTVKYGYKEVSVLSVYILVVNALSLLIQIIYSSFSPAFGAIVAKNDIEKTNQVFSVFQFLFFLICTFLFMCTAYLFLPFVSLYIQE